jgi:hypothetical protein
MAITYTWNCKTVDTYPTHSDGQDPVNEQNDVIYNVHWSLSGQLVANEATHSASVIGTQTLSTEDLSSFTSWDDLTHDQVIAWTTGSMIAQDSGSVDNKEASVSSSINLKINPISVTKYISE